MNATTQVTQIKTSKMAQARVIFAEVHAQGFDLKGKTQRAVFIQRAQAEIVDGNGVVNCSKNCAGTYYQNLSDNAFKGKGLYHRNKPAKKGTKASKADVKSAEAQVLLSLPHLAKERWMVVNEAGLEVNNFSTRSKAQDFAKVNGFKAQDRNKAA